MSTLERIAESLETSLMKRMDEFEAHLNQSKGSSSSPIKLEDLHKDFQAFKSSVWYIIKLLRQNLDEINKSVDIAEMRLRRKFLVVSGVPESKEENIQVAVIDVFRNKLQLKDFDSSCIKVCHRLGAATEGNTRSILVRFKDLTQRSDAWKNKSLLRGTGVVLSEFLTRHRQTMFVAARKHFGMRNVWTLDGNINIKLPNGSRCRVLTTTELHDLMAEHVKTFDELQPGRSTEAPVRAPPSVPVAKPQNPPRVKRATRNK